MNKEKTKLQHSASTKAIRKPLKFSLIDMTEAKENKGFNTARNNTSRKCRPKLNSITKHPALSVQTSTSQLPKHQQSQSARGQNLRPRPLISTQAKPDRKLKIPIQTGSRNKVGN